MSHQQGAVLKWNGKALQFESLSDFGESIQVEDLWTTTGWKKTIASDYIASDSIRLHGSVDKISTDLKYFLEAHAVSSKSGPDVRDCSIEYANASGLFNISIDLKNAFVAAVEWTSLKSGTDLRVVVELAFDSMKIKTIARRSAVPFEGIKIVDDLSSIKGVFRYDPEDTNFKGAPGVNLPLVIKDKVVLEPRYWASIPNFRLLRTAGASTNPLRDGPNRLSSIQPGISGIFNPDGEVSKREEYIDLAFYIYAGLAGPFEPTSESSKASSLYNALEVFAVACTVTSISSNLPAKDWKPLLVQNNSNMEKKMALPELHPTLKYPSDLFTKKGNDKISSKVDSSERNMVSQLLKVMLPDGTPFYGVISQFDFEVDRFDGKGNPARALVRMSLLGLNSMNRKAS